VSDEFAALTAPGVTVTGCELTVVTGMSALKRRIRAPTGPVMRRFEKNYSPVMFVAELSFQ
jgi:hypothetical protein